MKIPLPEQIALNYSPANFGSRAVAYICDFILRWTSIAALALILLYLLILTDSLQPALSKATELSNSATAGKFLIAVGIIFVFVVEWSYPIVFEVFRDGVSPGKQLVGLRVVDEDGLPISFPASFLRTALLIVDLLPATGLVALIFMSSSRRRQRVGDIIGRTVVIYDYESAPPALHSQLPHYVLPAPLYDSLQEFVSREPELLPESRATIAEQLLRTCSKILPNHKLSSEDPATLLRNLFLSSYPSRVWPATFDSRTARSWKADIDIIHGALNEVRLLEEESQLSHSEVRSVISAYHEATSVYAKWSTWFPNLACSRYAATVIRRARMVLYAGQTKERGKSSRSILERVQASYEKTKYHCLLAFSLSLIGGILSWLAVAVHPELSWKFLSEETAAQLQSGSIWTESLKGMNSVASAGIMTNNITVAINAFALGATAGIGTVIVLLFNGIHLGGTFAALVPYGMAPRLLEFILAHGFLELSIIFVAGGCGLFLADGIIRPGHRTRRQSLQEHARISADLLVYSAAWLVLAGVVEGYVSPNDSIHWVAKLLIGIAIGGLYWLSLLSASTKNSSSNYPLSTER